MSTYQTSKDYALLWELAMSGKEIACFVDYTYTGGTTKVYRDIAKARKNPFLDQCEIGVRGICYFDAETKEEFIKLCEKYHVEFIPPSGWIQVSERLPENEKPVLITVENCMGKRLVREGFWVSKRTKIADNDLWDSNEGDYDEKTGEYYWTEGWYATSDMDDVCWSLDADYKIIAWMPLPKPYEVWK